MKIENGLGSKIRRRRQELQLSQEELAAQIGLSVSLLRDIEHGRGNPTIKTLSTIFSGLGMEFESLFSNVQPILVSENPEEIVRNIAIQLKAMLALSREDQELASQIFQQLSVILQEQAE